MEEVLVVAGKRAGSEWATIETRVSDVEFIGILEGDRAAQDTLVRPGRNG